MKRALFRAVAGAGAVGLLWACTDNQSTAPTTAPPARPTFAEGVASNGLANSCMADDGLSAPTGYVSGNLLSGGALIPDFGCTSNDIDVATADITEWSTSGEPGSFNPVPTNGRIDCIPDQTLFVKTVAHLKNNAQSRYDIGIWIPAPTDASAMSAFTVVGGVKTFDHQCGHYNLILSADGVSNLEPTSPKNTQDACGDMSQGAGTASVDLDVLEVTCKANASTVTVNSCIGWQNSDDFKSRGFCPASYPNTGTAQEFRWGTLPETGSKCNCSGFTLPIDVKASLTLVKTISNDNGGTATVSNFPLTAAGPVTISGVSGTTDVTAAHANAGTYALSEQTVAGYQAGSWSCSGGTLSGSNLTLTSGSVATCTINNNDVGPKLTLVKTVSNDNGGTATTANFPLTAAGPVTISGASGSSTVTNATVNAGTYNLSETTLNGYTAGSWSCTSGGSNSQVTLSLGGSATCTINNHDNAPHLTLVKTVTNDNGGTKTPANFPLTAAGPVTITGTSGSSTVTNAAVSAGTYNLSETTADGYNAGAWSCSSGGSGTQVTITLGGSATCTINNNDVGAHLTLVKTITNDDGGSATVANFPLQAAGPVTIIGTSGSSDVTNAPVNAGTYNLTEGTQEGYQASSWSCSSGGSGTQVTLALGGSSTCTINNNDIAAHLTLVKTVTNDDGGTATSASFPLTAIGPSTITGTSGSSSVTGATVKAGTYTLSEQTQAGYTPSSWSCSSGGSTNHVTLPLAGSATCTINNDDIGAHLTLVKTVTNDDGGTGSATDFSLCATGSGAPICGNGGFSNTAVSAGTYQLSETTVAGYTAGSWSCTSGGSGSQVTLGLGGSSTCTINNNDNPAHLTLVKTVTNDDGGTATTDNFPLTAIGPSTITGTSGSGSVTGATVKAGTYNLSESTLVGYTAGPWSCTSGGSGTTVTLALGGSSTCTINNNDNGAHLTLVKVVTNDNGGTASGTDFSLCATGSGSPICGNGGFSNTAVSAGTYTLSETTLSGYQAGSWSCTSGGSANTVTLALGGSSTCTIANNDVPAHLTLVKTVTNDDGGSATTADFTLKAAGPVTITGTSGSGSVTNAQVNAGTYNLSETTLSGYAAGSWSCTSGGSGSQVTLQLAGSSTCTINNNDVAPHLTLVKTVTNDDGGTKTPADFTLKAAGPVTISGASGSGSVTGAAVQAGTYDLSETTLSGYAAGSWSCTSGGGTNQVTLAVGGSSTCTINNNDVAAHLTLVKVVTNDNGGTATTANFPLTAAGPVTISGVTGASAVTNASVKAGTYALSETTLSTYAPTGWSCTSGGSGSQVTLGLGESATCTIGNNDIAQGTGQILPTNTTCADFVAGNTTVLTTLMATLKGPNINSIAPGVFFYYATVVKGAGSTGFTQTASPSNYPLYPVLNGQAFLYTVSGGQCTNVATLTQVGSSGTWSGGASLPAGNYILGAKFQTMVPNGTKGSLLPATNTFQIIGGGSIASVQTVAKP